jgi:hypothetical protein
MSIPNQLIILSKKNISHENFFIFMYLLLITLFFVIN